MKIIIIFICCLALCVNGKRVPKKVDLFSLQSNDLSKSWQNFKVTFGKRYNQTLESGKYA
jgi:hypothetical protein